MAKYEWEFRGDFDTALSKSHDAVVNGSCSVSFKDGSDYESGGFRCAVRIHEHYSVMGGNRVRLSLALAAGGGDLFLSAITSGGSQAMLF